MAKKKPRPVTVVFDGAKLRDLRLGAGLTQTQLAERASLVHADVSVYERGLSEPTLAVAVRLAEALGVKVNELVKSPRPKNSDAEPPDSAE